MGVFMNAMSGVVLVFERKGGKHVSTGTVKAIT